MGPRRICVSSLVTVVATVIVVERLEPACMWRYRRCCFRSLRSLWWWWFVTQAAAADVAVETLLLAGGCMLKLNLRSSWSCLLLVTWHVIWKCATRTLLCFQVLHLFTCYKLFSYHPLIIASNYFILRSFSGILIYLRWETSQKTRRVCKICLFPKSRYRQICWVNSIQSLLEPQHHPGRHLTTIPLNDDKWG